ncbi:hypothetical protein B0J14DRAFT_579478 [Halenospora varia]|nr:hypothetical protein B0J14DRAFT_579478 [Halenospora varia]
MLALTSPTGRLGSAVLSAILEHRLISPTALVLLTSTPVTDSRFDTIKEKGITIRTFNFDHPDPKSFEGCDKLFLISSTHIELDFWNQKEGGREKHHKTAIDAAVKGGVKHVYYTSLAFHPSSKAGVMRAHLVTESYLRDLNSQGKVDYTVIREGLYNESWPLYLGYYDEANDRKREEIVLAGDGKISWTSIPDLGLATGIILTSPAEEYAGKTLYLSQRKKEGLTLAEVASLVGDARGKKLGVRVVPEKEWVEHYVSKGKDWGAVEWWGGTYGSLTKGEALIEDETLEKLLGERGVVPRSMEVTVRGMVGDA